MKPTSLDAVRGLAAWMVVLHHLLSAFAPAWTGASKEPTPAGFDWLFHSPLSMPWQGHYAVLIFFVLSGFVLSFKFFVGDGDRDYLVSAAVRRYIRLSGPAIGAILVGWALLRLDLMRPAAVAGVTGSDWLRPHYGFAPSFPAALWQGAYSYFFSSVPGESSYDTSLWTITTEFACSFTLFGFLALFGGLARRWLIYLVAVVLAFDGWFLSFLLGIALCDFYVFHRRTDRFRPPRALVAGALLAGIYLSGLQGNTDEFVWYGWVRIVREHGWQGQLHTLGAALLVFGVLFSERLQRVLSSRPFRLLGKLSYSVYLLHIPLLCSVGCLSFLGLRETGAGYVSAAVWASLAVVVAVLGASWVFQRYVDRGSIELARRFHQRWFGAANGQRTPATAQGRA